MGAAKGVLVVLTTIFLATDCLAQLWLKRNSDTEQSDICETALQTCMVPVSGNPRFSHIQFTNYQEITRNIGELCPLYTQIATCLRPKLPQCEKEEKRRAITLGLSIGDYICSLRGHSLMRDINKYSPCISSNRHDAIRRTIFSCIEEAYMKAHLPTSTPPTACQEARDQQKCTKKAIVQHCGVPAGEVVNEILNRIISSLPQFGCVSNNTRTRKSLGPGIARFI